MRRPVLGFLAALFLGFPAIAQAPQAGLAPLMQWAVKLTQYPAPSVLPGLDIKPREFFQQSYCDKFGIAAPQCIVVATFSDKTRTIHLWGGIQPEDINPILIHELVHYLQHENAPTLSRCAREYEAAYAEWSYRVIATGLTDDFQFDREFYQCPFGYESSPLVLRLPAPQ